MVKLLYMENQYVFIMTPNNSGSHLLAQVLLSSPKAAALPGFEGLFFKDFGKPPVDNVSPKKAFMFSSIENELRNFSIDRLAEVKDVWDREWNKFWDRPIKIEKSPPLICAHKLYPQVFPNYKYIVMHRNPFAVAEGMIRVVKEKSGEVITPLEAIHHSTRVLEICDEIVQDHPNNTIHFSYEDFTENPKDYIDKILNFIPDLEYLKIEKEYNIKRKYKSPIINMNQQQIDRLNLDDLKIMKDYFETKKQNCTKENSFILKY
jgi:hypothetical protein